MCLSVHSWSHVYCLSLFVYLQLLANNFFNFRCLRTLLLEGNQLTSLPPQLGCLSHLTGLNIANNPLTSPPSYVIEKGTKVAPSVVCWLVKCNYTMLIQAVLKYLRDCLNETEKVEPDNNVNSVSKHTVPLQPIDNKFSLVASMLISNENQIWCYAFDTCTYRSR